MYNFVNRIYVHAHDKLYAMCVLCFCFPHDVKIKAILVRHLENGGDRM